MDDARLPTREFISFANWLFDAVDQKFEPRNTGLCEMPKFFRINNWVSGNGGDQPMELMRHFYSKNSFEGMAYEFHNFSIPYVLVPQNALGHLGRLEISSDAIIPSLIGMTKCESFNNVSWPVATIPALTRLGFHKLLFFTIRTEEYAAARHPQGPLNIPDIELFDETFPPEHIMTPVVAHAQKVNDGFYQTLGTHLDLTKTSVHPDHPSVKDFEDLAARYAAAQSSAQNAGSDALQSLQMQQIAAMQNIAADQRMLSNTSGALMRDSVGSSSWYDYRYRY